MRVCVLSLSQSYGKNSSWIVFLEEETNVKMTKLVQVLAKFDRSKVSIPTKPPFLSLFLRLSLLLRVSVPNSSARPELSCFELQLSWSLVQLRDTVSGWLQLLCSCWAPPSHSCQTCHLSICCGPNLSPFSPVMKSFFLNMNQYARSNVNIG